MGVALALNLSVFLLEIAGGIWADSLALISDALHNLSDCATLVLALVAIRLAASRATSTRTFGHLRAEVLVAAVNALTLLAVGVYIVYEGIGRVLDPPEVEGGLVMAFGTVGLVANLASTLVIRPYAHADLNARSAFLHLATDAAESAAVIAGGILVYLGFPIADPILSLGIGALTMKGAIDVLRAAIRILDEGAPAGADSDAVARCLRSVPGVCDVHHVHVWSLSSRFRALSAHVVVQDQRIGEAASLVQRMSEAVHEEFGIEHPTFQLEVGDCADRDCSR
jgi:cobalt-zinc-cadmium efflux system protein